MFGYHYPVVQCKGVVLHIQHLRDVTTSPNGYMESLSGAVVVSPKSWICDTVVIVNRLNDSNCTPIVKSNFESSNLKAEEEEEENRSFLLSRKYVGGVILVAFSLVDLFPNLG